MLTTNAADVHVPIGSHSSVRGNALADTSNVETLPNYLPSPSDVLKEADDRLLLGRWYSPPSENDDVHGMQGSVINDAVVKPVLATPDTYTFHGNLQSSPGFVPSVVSPSLHSVYGKPTNPAQDVNIRSLSPQRSQPQLVTTMRTLQCGTMANTVFNELQDAGDQIIEENKLRVLYELQLSQLGSQGTLLHFEYGQFMPSVPNSVSDLTTVSHLTSEIDTHALSSLPVHVLPTSVSIAYVVSSSVTAGSGKFTVAGSKMASKKDAPTNQSIGLSSDITDGMDQKLAMLPANSPQMLMPVISCDSKSSLSQEFSEIQSNEMPFSMSSKMAEFGVTLQRVNSNLVAESGEFSDDDFEEIFIERYKRKSETYPSTLPAPKRVQCQGSSKDIVQPRSASVGDEELVVCYGDEYAREPGLIRDKNMICSYSSKKSGHWKTHMRIHTGEQPYKCEVCDYACNRSDNLKTHMQIHTGERLYKCEVCGFVCNRDSYLKKHMKIHTAERPYKCKECDYKCIQSGGLKRHMWIHTGEKPYKCEMCDYICNDSGNLMKHMTRHTGERLYTCEVCGYAFNTNCNLKAHMRIHTGERPFNCEVCGFVFNQSNALKRHMRIHTGERPYNCEVCGYACTQSDNLKTHMRIHTEERPYKCEVCSYACNWSGDLKMHMTIHTGETRYKCRVCDYACNKRSSLKTHMMIHTGEKPYTCEVCGYACKTSGNLTDHMRLHTGERPYKCEVCGFAFKNSGHLKRHVKMHTGENKL